MNTPPSGPWSRTADAAPRELRPGERRGCAFAFLLVFALVWNGVIGAAMSSLFRGRSGGFDGCAQLFMIPFALVGLLLIGGCVYLFLGLFNPRVTMTMTPGAVPLGGSFELTWQIMGRHSRITSLAISIEAREEASYRRGTDSVTDKRVFHCEQLAHEAEPAKIATGCVTVRVPIHLMHSFDATNNKIIWSLRAHGDIPRWPDVNETFQIDVLPRPDGAPGTLGGDFPENS